MKHTRDCETSCQAPGSGGLGGPPGHLAVGPRRKQARHPEQSTRHGGGAGGCLRTSGGKCSPTEGCLQKEQVNVSAPIYLFSQKEPEGHALTQGPGPTCARDTESQVKYTMTSLENAQMPADCPPLPECLWGWSVLWVLPGCGHPSACYLP